MHSTRMRYVSSLHQLLLFIIFFAILFFALCATAVLLAQNLRFQPAIYLGVNLSVKKMFMVSYLSILC